MSQHYKIALVKNGSYTTGGVSSVCWFLCQTIRSKERYDIQLFSLETSYNSPVNVRLFSSKSWFKGIEVSEYIWNNIPVKHVGINLPEFEFQRYMPRGPLTSLLNQFDLVHVVTGGPAAANVVRNIAKPVCLSMATLVSLERKSITQNTNFIRKAYDQLMLPIISRIEKRALSQVDHVFADTEYTRQAILPSVESSKITIDVIGVDTQLFTPIDENQRTNDYILSVGRLGDARKNVTMLFEAYALLRERMSDAPRLVLAGKTGPTPAAWAVANDLGIIDHIIFIKDVSVDTLVTLYQNAAVYVLSSTEEGLGIVLLEAMACATPVISTRCGGPDSVVLNNTGFLTPVGDAMAMAERLHWLLHNKKVQRRLGQNGRRMVEARFSNEVVGKKYFDVYDRLLGVDNT